MAVLFQAKNLVALRSAINGRVALAGADHPRAAAIQGEIFGVKYAGRRSPDREICCYVATLGECVVVTNSPKQLERLIRVHHGDIPALASLDEYKFFRHRYPQGNDKETGFLIISDDTIRRWCGPRWRIATSRRTRAAAVMSELQAKHLKQLVRGQETAGEVESDYWLPEVDHFTLTARGVYSDTYGSLEFQTPIAEMELEFATAEDEDTAGPADLVFLGGQRYGLVRPIAGQVDQDPRVRIVAELVAVPRVVDRFGALCNLEPEVESVAAEDVSHILTADDHHPQSDLFGHRLQSCRAHFAG